MVDLSQKEYIAVIQCDIVQQRCPGFLCEKAFNDRTGGFADYPKDKKIRMLSMTCGGCCGRSIHRKLALLVRRLEKFESIGKDKIVVQLSSCITNDNYHAPPCPHLDYLKKLISKLELDVVCQTEVCDTSVKLREEGVYGS